MERNETRSDIIRIGTELIGAAGFNATGLDCILKKAGVPKGSFYYYFRSKDDFGLAIIDRAAAEHAQKLEGFLRNEKYSALRRIRNYLENGVDSCIKKGCLMGTLGQELASQNEKFRKRIDEVFGGWTAQFAECFREAKTAGDLPRDADPELLASFLLTGWEGAILRAKVMKSSRPMSEFIEIFSRK